MTSQNCAGSEGASTLNDTAAGGHSADYDIADSICACRQRLVQEQSPTGCGGMVQLKSCPDNGKHCKCEQTRQPLLLYDGVMYLVVGTAGYPKMRMEAAYFNARLIKKALAVIYIYVFLQPGIYLVLPCIELEPLVPDSM